MKNAIRVGIVLVLLSFSFSATGYCHYANLVGKWVQINGPYLWGYLGVAMDKETCDHLIDIVDAQDKQVFRIALKSPKIIGIRAREHAMVTDVELFERMAKVRILSGINAGLSGWVPLEWLDGNEERPQLSGTYPEI